MLGSDLGVFIKWLLLLHHHELAANIMYFKSAAFRIWQCHLQNSIQSIVLMVHVAGPLHRVGGRTADAQSTCQQQSQATFGVISSSSTDGRPSQGFMLIPLFCLLSGGLARVLLFSCKNILRFIAAKQA